MTRTSLLTVSLLRISTLTETRRISCSLLRVGTLASGILNLNLFPLSASFVWTFMSPVFALGLITSRSTSHGCSPVSGGNCRSAFRYNFWVGSVNWNFGVIESLPSASQTGSVVPSGSILSSLVPVGCPHRTPTTWSTSLAFLPFH